MKKSIETFIEGEHCVSLGLLTLAREKIQEALEINKKNGDEEGIGVCLIYLAQIEIKENRKATAQEYLDQAREHYRQRNMEDMLTQLDLLQEVIDNLKQNLTTDVTVPKTKNPQQPAAVDPFQLFREGEVEAAAKIFVDDILKFRQSDNQRKLAMSLLYLGQCQFTLGKHSDAFSHLNEAREIAQKIQDHELIHTINGVFENIALIEQQKELDKLTLQELLEQDLTPTKKLMMLLSKAEIQILKGLGQEAERAIHEARKLLPQQNVEKQLVLIMIVESKLLRFRGKIDSAQKLLDQAKEIAEKIREPELVRLVEKSIFEN